MSLQLILGGSGSGKSHTLYTDIIAESQKYPEKNYLIIVPEQFTMQTQKELVRLHPKHGILNIDILSFQRLAHRVFEETGEDQRVILTETGKNLLIRKTAANLEPQLKLLGSKLDKPGYISEIKSMLSELTQYEISEGDLEEMIALAEHRPQLQYKLQDLLVLYRGFRTYQKDRFLTAEELLDVFCAAIPKSEKLKNSILAFDGFTGFTPVQQNALRELLGVVPDIKITVTLDPKESLDGRYLEHELFYLSKKTIHTLLKLAEETGTEVLEPVLLSGKNGRFCPGSQLDTLEKNLFRYGKRKKAKEAARYFVKEDGRHLSKETAKDLQKEEMSEQIFLHTARNPMEEARYAARTISQMVKKEKLRYRDIAVITGDLNAYGNYVKKIFEAYEIPCFVDRTMQILLNPCLEFIRGAFGVVDYNFSYESIFRFLRTGLTGLTSEETDRLENYVLALGIRGEKGWKQTWDRSTRSMTAEEYAVCDTYRSRVMETLLPFVEVMKRNDLPLQDYVKALYTLMTKCQMQEQLKQLEEQFAQSGCQEQAKEYSQIYGIVLEILDEAVDLLGDESVSRTEFEEILEAGFSEARVGMIPPGIDQVHVGDIERTRLDHIKVLFFLGLNDGWVPVKDGAGGIVSELEREFLQEAGVELAPTARQNSYIQRFYLYLSLTKPKEQLYLSFCKSSSDGAAMRPSYLIGMIQKLYPGLTLEDEEELENPLRNVTSKKNGLAYLAEGLRDLRLEKETKTENCWRELYRQYYLDPQYHELTENLTEAAFLVFNRAGIKPKTAEALYGEVLENSVTRLEQFAACAFAHFAAYGLQLTERETYQVRSMDLGTVFHRALELFSRKLQTSEYDWFTLPQEIRTDLIDQSVTEAVEQYSAGLFYATARNEYLIERIRRILKRSVWAMNEQIQAGSFAPSNFEVPFDASEDLKTVNLQLGEQAKMKLKGRIDRIDTCMEPDQVYVKVIDYKSGNTTFDLVSLYYGLQLQLVVYLNAAMEMEKRIYPGKQVLPAGIFYYRMQDPLIEGKGQQTEEEIQEEILKKLKVDGLINDDPEIVSKLDNGFVKASRVIPVGRKADGSWTAASSVASTRQLDQLSQFVQDKLETLGREILQGTVAADPYERKTRKACDYCNYAEICGFDTRIPGADFRKLKEFEKDEIWGKMEPESEKTKSDQKKSRRNTE